MIWVFGDCTRRFSEIYEEILKSARKDCLTLVGELWYSFGREFFIFCFDGDGSYVCICGECRKLMMRKGIEKGRTMEENDGFRLFFKDVPRASGGDPG